MLLKDKQARSIRYFFLIKSTGRVLNIKRLWLLFSPGEKTNSCEPRDHFVFFAVNKTN
jgi:hypothetical protein